MKNSLLSIFVLVLDVTNTAALGGSDINKMEKRQQNISAPSASSCPAGQTIRIGTAINQKEADYVRGHTEATQKLWAEWLSSSKGPNLDTADGIRGGVAAYTGNISNLPRVGIALSGGGLRATLNGMGYLQGLDSRNSTAVERGTGGFLQLSSYIAGISGGSWTVGGLAGNDWPTTQALHDDILDLSAGIFTSPNSSTNQTQYFANIDTSLTAKQSAGYQLSFIDLWGNMLQSHFLADGSNNLWSGITQTAAFTNVSYPFPLVTTNQQVAGQVTLAGNGTIWEFNPYEVGSWDAGIEAFTPTPLFGSTFNSGMATRCGSGFDTFGYILGLSSAIFNSFSAGAAAILGGSFNQAINSAFPTLSSQLANPLASIPNPFNLLSSSPLVSQMGNITLVDGGEDGQSIPLVPLLQPSRGLDFILAIDSGTDTPSGWPAGYSLFATYTRFAIVSNRGLNTRPTFFGCNGTTDVVFSDKTTKSTTKPPIIAYIPNYPYTYLTNYSTNQLQMSNDQSQATIDNGFQSATLAGITSGSEIDWPLCLACASLQRSFERSNTPIPDKCKTCMEKYCWNGTVNNTVPSTDYTPAIGISQWVIDGAANKMTTSSNGASIIHSTTLCSLSVIFVTSLLLLI